MAKVHSTIQMEINILVILLMDFLTDMENTFGLIVPSIEETSNAVLEMAMEYGKEKVGRLSKGIICLITSTVSVSMTGQMGTFIRESSYRT